MKEQKSMMLFESTIKSDATKQTYQLHLRKLLQYSKIKDYDSLITLGPKQIQTLLEDYLLYCRKKYSANSISVIFSCYQSFFSYHVDGINFKRLRRMYPAKEKLSGKQAYTTDQVRFLIENTISREIKTALHFMACSGVRIGSLCDLKLKHLEDMPNGCKSVLVYADTISEYTTFITPECFEVLENYLAWRKQKGQTITKDSYVFVRPDGKKHKPNDQAVALCMLSTKLLNREKSNKIRYDVQSSHGLRKRFNTILKLNNEINPNIAERLLGHSQSIKLDNSYFTPSKDQLFNEYQKAIPELLIDEKYKLKFELKNQKAKIKDLESDKDRRIEKLEIKLETLNEFVKSFSK